MGRQPPQDPWGRSLALLSLVGLLAACPGAGSADGSDGASRIVDTVSVAGRVVDFQSCFGPSGCQGVRALRVSLFFDTAVRSAVTADDGVFRLTGVPAVSQSYLLVTVGVEGAPYLTTLQARPLRTERRPITGLEIYALRADGSLYRAIEQDLSSSVESAGIYLGQVLTGTNGAYKAVPGAGVSVSPAAPVRYVKTDPAVDPEAKELFYPTTQEGTGGFGQFVVVGAPQQLERSIVPARADKAYEPLVAIMGSGFVSIGLHHELP